MMAVVWSVVSILGAALFALIALLWQLNQQLSQQLMGSITRLSVDIAELRTEVRSGIGTRLDGMDRRLDGMDRRLDTIDQRLDRFDPPPGRRRAS